MPGLPILLGLLFIGLKLAGVIAWSWLWVLSPFWITAAVGILLVSICLMAALVGVRVAASLRFR